MKPVLEELLPHDRPMLLLDRLVSVDDERAETEVDVTTAAMFAVPEGIGAWVGIEYMAQTVSIIAGWRARRNGEPVRIGYLLGTRSYAPAVSIFDHGTTLRIAAEEEWMEPNGMARFRCSISVNEKVLADAALVCYQPPDGLIVNK